MPKLAVISLLLSTLIGCTIPAKTIETSLVSESASSGYATVIVSQDPNNFGFSAPAPPDIYVNGEKIGTFNFGDKIIVQVAPGRQTVRVPETILGADFGASIDEVSFELEADECIHLGFGLTSNGRIPVSDVGRRGGPIWGKLVFYQISGPQQMGLKNVDLTPSQPGACT